MNNKETTESLSTQDTGRRQKDLHGKLKKKLVQALYIVCVLLFGTVNLVIRG